MENQEILSGKDFQKIMNGIDTDQSGNVNYTGDKVFNFIKF